MFQLPLTTYALRDLIAYTRENSPFYQQLYAGLPTEVSLHDLPVINQAEYWESHYRDPRSVLTGPLHDGAVFNSGGTTGVTKFSYFSEQDWHSIIAISAQAFQATGLRDGDRVANTFSAGSMYASFLLATESMKWMPAGVMQFPLGYTPDPSMAALMIHRYKINVLAGFPTNLMRIVEHIDQQGYEGVHIDRMVFGGEVFAADQREFLQKRFPGIEIRSASYASVDAGLMGYADATCGINEHRIFDGVTMPEIIDEETNELIVEERRPGRIVFTSLFRRLMPLIRYPAGDRAQWIEPPGAKDRKFLLLGRSEEAARVARYSVPVTEVTNLLEPFRERLGIEDFQLLVTHENLLDRVTFRVAVQAPDERRSEEGEEIIAAFRRRRPDMDDPISNGLMHPPVVAWIRRDQLTVNTRTGKLLRVVDQRNA